MINRNYVEELTKKWEAKNGKLGISGIEDMYVKEQMAIMLENQERKDFDGNEVFMTESQGAISTGSLGSLGQADGPGNYGSSDAWKFRPVALALVRRTFPDLFAHKVVGVQAMSTPVGLAYALRVVYQNSNGTEAAWDNVENYAAYTGAGAGTSGVAWTDTITSGASAVGGTSGAGYNGAATSAGENWSFNNTCLSASSGCPDFPQLQIKIDQRAIEAKIRQLGASFSLVSAQDIRAMQGIDIEREMVNILQYEVSAELDREILAHMKNAAINGTGGAPVSVIDCTVGSASSFGRWSGEGYMSIIASIVHQANQIAISTRRGPGNFVVVSPAIASALQAAGHQFVNYTQNVNPTTTMAAIGKLNGTIDVYRDQYAGTSNYALVGYKGPGIADSGIVFSPYIMGLTNRAVDPRDFSPKIGVMSRYAITDNLLGAGRYYRMIGYTNVSSLLPGA